MQKIKSGVSAKAKRALTCAAIAGAAGLSLGGAAYAADDAAMATADADGGTTVQGLDVIGRRKAIVTAASASAPTSRPPSS